MNRPTRCIVVFALLVGACASADTAPTESSALTIASATTVSSTADAAGTQPVPTVVSTTTTAITTSTTAAPTTTTDPLAPAREAFLVMETEWETSSDLALNTHGDGIGVLWEDQPDWCTDQATVDAKWASDITGYTWPPELEASADELAVALTVRSGVFEECSRLPGTWDGQRPVWDRTDAAYIGLNTARDILRLALGLPRIEYA